MVGVVYCTVFTSKEVSILMAILNFFINFEDTRGYNFVRSMLFRDRKKAVPVACCGHIKMFVTYCFVFMLETYYTPFVKLE